MNTERNYIYHLLAIVIVAIWGLTFISTKKLIADGLTPQEIFLLRFLIAYIGIWLVSPKKLFADSWADELWMLALGVTGGSMYFLTENTALGITLATNVSFIVCTTPLITALLSLLFYKNEKAGRGLIVGSLTALVGMGLVVYNGSFVLKISPLGDFLSLLASLSWAFYSLIMKRVGERYSTVFITRKVFFYGLLTILPAFIVHPWQFPLTAFADVSVWGNLLFLGVVASLLCFGGWNLVMKRLGMLRSSNYIYLNPLFTLVGAVIFLDERLTWMALLGSVLLLGGVYLAEKK
ncbi:MAG: DMT family transporter [Bacteroides sp.]|nr:DMT family transporter [Bacteroides sp.]